MISFFLFDLDGTLIDSEEANYQAYKNAYKHFQIKLTKDLFLPFTGAGFKELAKGISPNLSSKERAELKSLKASAYKARLDLIIPNHPMISFLKYISTEYKTALVTTASRSNAEAVINYLNFSHCFSVKVFGDDITQYKPAPECYHLALTKLGARAEQCVAFEDSPQGISAAKNAGISAINV